MDWSAQGGSAPANYQEFLVPAMFEPFAETLAEQAGVRTGVAVLDVACGTGAASRAAARRAGASGSVTGVDLGEPTLQVARAQPTAEGSAPITWLQADATALPVDDATFDVAMCQQGLQFFPDKPRALAEMHRALKPGGRLAIATWTRLAQSPFDPIVSALKRHMGQEAAEVLASPFRLTASDLRDVVEGAGFAEVEVLEESHECEWAATPDEFAARTIACGPFAQQFAAAPEDQRTAVSRDVAEGLRAHTAGGAVRMTMTSNVALAQR